MDLKRRYGFVPLGVLMLVPVLGSAATQTYICGMPHYVRNAGTELASTTLSIRNADPAFSATIERLTVRDGDGNVVHDSGPATTTSLPLNTDFPNTYPGGRDITQVPPHGSVYLRSNHIWGNNGLPTGSAGNETGQSLSAYVVVSKEGPKSLLSLQTTPRIRTRVFNQMLGTYTETATLATGNSICEATP